MPGMGVGIGMVETLKVQTVSDLAKATHPRKPLEQREAVPRDEQPAVQVEVKNDAV